MANPTAPAIELDEELRRFIAAHLDAGRYQTASDMVRAGLAMLVGTPVAPEPGVDENEGLLALTAALALQVAERTRERDRIWQVSRDLLGVTDENGVWISVNPAWERVLGWREDQLIGKTSAWLLHNDDLPLTEAGLASLADGASSVAFENRYRRHDANYSLLSWSVAAIEGRRYCVARDVTAERERELALHDSRDFARLALSAVSGVGVWTYEVSSDCFFCDANISEVYGLDPVVAAAGIKRAAFLANVHEDDREPLRATMAGGLVRSGDLELEYRIAHPDGSTRWVLSRGHTYFNDHGEPVRRTGVGVDMTSQRQLEQQLRQSQKMEAVGQLTGGIAHDFNNLLAGIMGSLEMLTLRTGQGRIDDLPRYIAAAQNAANRAAALTHRLLAFSRRQPLAPVPTHLNQLVAGMEDLIRRTVGSSIPIQFIPYDEQWETLVDPNQLENALLNLCINARDAMPGGGRITIETANEYVSEQDASLYELTAGAYVVLSVKDTGTGMTPQVIAQAFDPFFTTKAAGKGTGLGLSMIYGFTRQSGGHARITSAPGEGTEVSLYLPRYDGVTALPERA